MYLLKNRKSFTLIEAIVAVAIISLIFSLSVSFIWLSFKLAARSKAVAVRFYGIRNVFELLSTDLRSASEFNYAGIPDFVLQDEGRSISFWIVAPPQNVQRSYQYPILRITYFMKKENNAALFYRKIESPFEHIKQEAPISKAHFEFSALVYSKDKKNILEEDTYPKSENENKLPLAVKVRCRKAGTKIERVIYLPYNKEF